MNKIISALILSVLIFPMIIFAQEGKVKECCTLYKTITIDTVTCNKDTIAAPNATAAGDCTGVGGYCAASKDIWGMLCIFSSIYRVTDWVSYLLFAFVGLMIIIGAVTIVTAGGAPDKVSTGRNYIMYAVIGLIVALFARAIPSLAKAIIGM